MRSTIHILTHTHWDREWFLPAALVNEWLEELFDRLFLLIDEVPAYRYILDGQTMILEDYLAAFPERRAEIESLAKAGNLLIGPYYGQNDWRSVSEEALIRNLSFGVSDARSYGNLMDHGWILDNFGHCSQSPQIHKLFGLEDVFVWRGPVFPGDEIVSDFFWEGPDGSRLLAHFFISGYRNFYNLSETEEYIDLRIDQLKTMLEPHTPHGHLVFLDGYDTDAWPEDPFQFLINQTAEFIRSTPGRYDAEVRAYSGLNELPVLRGELYSGKYACIFPGSLSARTYLRIQNALVERLLTFYVEPLIALLPEDGSADHRRKIEFHWRELLKTHLHDNIGGVSVDQVHDAMEKTYRRLYDTAIDWLAELFAAVAVNLGLEGGRYAFLPVPYRFDRAWLHGEASSYSVSSAGAGFCRVQEEVAFSAAPIPVDKFAWQNPSLNFEISADGAFLNGAPVGGLWLEEDAGDTYSADTRPLLPRPEAIMTELRVVQQSEASARLRFARQLSWGEVAVRTEEEIILDQSPLVQWRLAIDTRGTNYRLRMAYETGDEKSAVFARMPFTIDRRLRRDANYFGAEIPEALRPVLLAAREVGSVDDFPFQGFVALTNETGTQAILARGLREYQVDKSGTILVTLKRSVEWLAKRELRTRLGDAGPYMYVPSAKCERETQFELGFLSVEAGIYDRRFLKWCSLFETGFVVFDNAAEAGTSDVFTFWDQEIPWSGLQPFPDGPSILRIYNPTPHERTFDPALEGTDPFGSKARPVSRLGPYKIEHLLFKRPKAAASVEPDQAAPQPLVAFPAWPVGPDRSRIEDEKLGELKALAATLRTEMVTAENLLPSLSAENEPTRYHQTKHKIFRLSREILEAELSVLLNEWKRKPQDQVIQDKVREVGRRLNLVRRQRRTYDYVLSLFAD